MACLSSGIVLGIQNGTLFLISLIAVLCYLVIVFAFQRPFDRLNQETMISTSEMPKQKTEMSTTPLIDIK